MWPTSFKPFLWESRHLSHICRGSCGSLETTTPNPQGQIQNYHTRALNGGDSEARRGLIWVASDIAAIIIIYIYTTVADDIPPISRLKMCIMAETTRTSCEKPTI